MCEYGRRIESESKLEREMKNLMLLKEKVGRSSHLTKGIVNILSSCEQRLAFLDETVFPFYHQTKNLQIKQKNIRHTLEILDPVIAFYETGKDVQAIIHSGPRFSTNGDSNLKHFLKAMEKLQSAIQYFENHNSDCAEHNEVIILFNQGSDALNEHFRNVLLHHSKPVPLMILLDLVRPAEESPVQCQSNFDHLSIEVCAELQSTARWLKKNYGNEYIDTYVTVRGATLHKSIQDLKEHQQSLSGGSVQSISVANSPLVQKKKFKGSSNSRASKLLQHLFEKKANKMLLKASQNLESSSRFSIGSQKSGILTGSDNRDDSVDEQEMVNYLMCMIALQKLMEIEKNLMSGIVTLDLLPNALENLIQDALNMVTQEGENIAFRTRKCINRHEFTAIFIAFPILKHLQCTLPEYKKLVEKCSEAVTTKFSVTYDILHDTISKALDDFIERIHTDPSIQVPKDGTVHELTSNTLVFLEQLQDFTDLVGGILAQKFQYKSALTFASIAQLPGEYGKIDDNKMILGMYIHKVLNELNQTLCNKSKLYSDTSLRDVFQLNNNHKILKSLRESGLLSIVELSKPNFESICRKIMNEKEAAYIQSWNKVLCYIWPLDDSHALNLGSSKIKSKDKNIIKEKFSGFNKEMEEIVKTQHEYSIADDELRKSLKENNKQFIGPKYKAFYEKYNKIPFTKNPKKYIKYTPEQILSMIDQFFDVAA